MLQTPLYVPNLAMAIVCDAGRSCAAPTQDQTWERSAAFGHRLVEIAAEGDEEKFLLLHEALEKLAAIDPLKAEVVKLHYFAAWFQASIAIRRGLFMTS